MNTYVILLRGINVGGKNKLPMAELRACLQELGCKNVVTYIQSGNVILSSPLDSAALGKQIEAALPNKFQLSSEIIKVLVIPAKQFMAVIHNKPPDFGDQPKKYHSDVIFLINTPSSDAMKAFSPKAGIDTIWQGKAVIYSQRLSAQRTKSRLNKVMASPLYKLMTIRNWNTVIKLSELLTNYS